MDIPAEKSDLKKKRGNNNLEKTLSSEELSYV
jgi:hypothetical protein